VLWWWGEACISAPRGDVRNTILSAMGASDLLDSSKGFNACLWSALSTSHPSIEKVCTFMIHNRPRADLVRWGPAAPLGLRGGGAATEIKRMTSQDVIAVSARLPHS